jgi:hypothetical protein
MGYYTYTKDPIGMFVEKEHGNTFEYSVNDDASEFGANYPHKVWVGSQLIGGDQGYRYAKVMKTVAYVIVDEDEGGPVLERWFLKKHKKVQYLGSFA